MVFNADEVSHEDFGRYVINLYCWEDAFEIVM